MAGVPSGAGVRSDFYKFPFYYSFLTPWVELPVMSLFLVFIQRQFGEEVHVWDEETELRSSGQSVRRFVITGVADPREETPDFMGLKDAVAKGIINERRGLYINPATRVSMPIAEAMNKGFIQVEFSY